MTVSVGPAIDYLYGLAEQSVTGIQVNNTPAVAVDGWPDRAEFGMFYVGLAAPVSPESSLTDAQASGTRSWAALGGLRLEEDYTVPCCLDFRQSGTSQKAVRDLTHGVFDAFWALLADDLTLGGLLRGGRYAEIVNFATTPANVGTAAEPGRRQIVTFGVHCRNLTS